MESITYFEARDRERGVPAGVFFNGVMPKNVALEGGGAEAALDDSPRVTGKRKKRSARPEKSVAGPGVTERPRMVDGPGLPPRLGMREGPGVAERRVSDDEAAAEGSWSATGLDRSSSALSSTPGPVRTGFTNEPLPGRTIET